MTAVFVKAKAHPNEFDQRRIERALERRARYRYVVPRVVPMANGYRIESPCCSRNVKADGAIIDIALIEYNADENLWCLYYKNHETTEWLVNARFCKLHEALEILTEDQERKFWQ